MNNDKTMVFLNDVFPELYKSIKNYGSNSPKEIISMYVNRLTKIMLKISNSTDKEHCLNMMFSFFYRNFIIKPKNFPNSEFDLFLRIARERNEYYGEVTLESKKKYISEVIGKQKESLKSILSYFTSDDAEIYPMWAKIWAINSIINMGEFDKEKGEFKKRTKTTAKPFLDLNQELLNKCIQYILDKLDGITDFNDDQLDKLIANGSFAKLYSHILLENEQKVVITTDEGIWKKYIRGSEPKELFND